MRLLLTAATFAVFLGYAVVRYNVFGGVAWQHLPVFVVNKAVSWLALTLIAVSLGARTVSSNGAGAARWAGLTGAWLALVHVALTLAILSPRYYAKLHGPDGGLTWLGELAVLLGASTLAMIALQAWRTLAGSAADRQAPFLVRSGWLVALLGAAHCTALGWKGWWSPSAWPGGLPPITLIAVVTAVVGLGFRAARVRRPDGTP